MAQRSLDGFLALDDQSGEAAALTALGEAAFWSGQLEEAQGYLEHALTIRRERSDDLHAMGETLSGLGAVKLMQKQLDESEEYFQQALVIDREIGDRHGEGGDLSTLGQVALRRGQLDDRSQSGTWQEADEQIQVL
jgi:tetratricopeptide (TPR) repeat protein